MRRRPTIDGAHLGDSRGAMATSGSQVAPLCSAGALTAALRASRLCEQIVADRQQWPASSISRADAVSAGPPAAGVRSEL